MQEPFLSSLPRWFGLAAAAGVLALTSGCMTVNHYSAVDLSEPVNLAREAVKPTSLPMVVLMMVASLAAGAAVSWLVLRLRTGRGQQAPTETYVVPALPVAKTRRPEEMADDEYRSEFHEPIEDPMPAAILAAPAILPVEPNQWPR